MVRKTYTPEQTINKLRGVAILITGYPDSDMMARALARGPFRVMNKPFGESDIITAVNSFLRITR